MKTTAIYMRVSTRQQDTASQEPDLTRYADALDGSVEWYRDEATGRTMDRPAWNRLTDAIRLGGIDRLVVWRLDRLGRTASGLTTLFDDLAARGVNLVSLRDGIDLATPAGRLMAGVLASVAQYETEVRGERVRAGQAAARARGKCWGGSVKGRKIKNRAKAEQVAAIHRLKSEGMKVASIARTTGLSRQTVYVYLDALQHA